MQLKLALFALFIPGISHAADDAAQTRARYAAVDRAVPKATVIKRELEGYSLEGGDLTAYFQKGVPLKMVATHYGESGRAINEFYFWQGRLFFVVRTVQSYNAPFGTRDEAKKFKTTSTERYYFKNGEMWLWINPSGDVIQQGKGFEMQKKYQLQFTRQMLAGARRKAKVIEAPKGSGMN